MLSTPINPQIICKLINKDWNLYRHFVLGYVVIGLLSAMLMALPSELSFHAGVVLLITVLMGASAHLCISLTVIEKKEYQLSFIMGLPLSAFDYSLSKLLGGLAIYFSVWAPIITLTAAVIWFTPLPNGLMPMLLISGLEILTATTLLFCVAVVTGSEPITILTMVLLNLFFSIFLFLVTRLEDINLHISSPSAVFNQTVIAILAAEVVVTALFVALTLYIKSHRPCFL